MPTVTDRVVQMALKLVLEPIFEPDQYRSSYAYRPGRRAQDAVAEIVHYINNGYTWVVEGDIEGCFDNIRHSAVVERIRRRVTDRKVINLCKAFLKAGVLTELGRLERRISGTPQGGLCSAEHNDPWGEPSSVGVNHSRSTTPAFSHRSASPRAGNVPSWLRMWLWSSRSKESPAYYPSRRPRGGAAVSRARAAACCGRS